MKDFVGEENGILKLKTLTANIQHFLDGEGLLSGQVAAGFESLYAVKMRLVKVQTATHTAQDF